MALAPRKTDAAALTPEEFAAEAGVSRETLKRLEAYARLLRKWQRTVNLVGPETLPDIWRRHMLDSVQIAPLLPPAPGPGKRVIVDLGSGAGFPGLVLAIMGAGEVHLIESDRRKCVFLREASRQTGAPAVIHPVRAEELAKDPDRPRAVVVTSRALAPLTKLVGLAAPFLAPDGVCLFLKGREVDRELTAAGKEWNMRVEKFPSRTSPEGTILRLTGISLERREQ